MNILIGTKREQIEIKDVGWIIIDQTALKLTTDGDRAVIEEVRDDDKDL